MLLLAFSPHFVIDLFVVRLGGGWNGRLKFSNTSFQGLGVQQTESWYSSEENEIDVETDEAQQRTQHMYIYSIHKKERTKEQV